MPYLRAKAGIACAGPQSTNATASRRNMLKGTDLARTRLPLKLINLDQSIRPSGTVTLRLNFLGSSCYGIERLRRPMSVLLPHTAFRPLRKGVDRRITRGRRERRGGGHAHKALAKAKFSIMREHRDFPSTTDSPFRKKE